MMLFKRCLAASFVVGAALLSGCAATVSKPTGTQAPLAVAPAATKQIVMHVTGGDTALKSADWELLRAEWRTQMKAASDAAGLPFRYQEAAPKAGDEDGTVVVVRVNDYRYLTAGARYGFGVFTGNAFVDTDVDFLDLRSGSSFGKRKYNSSSSAWEGIFSAMTDKQLLAICTEIVGEVKKTK